MTQAEALDILKTGANVFLTGEPGSGKTHTINEYIRYLKAANVPVAVTASTGIAATHLGGMTIHSWSGIGIKKSLSPYDIDRIASTSRVAKRIGGTAVLVIDEISMLDGQTVVSINRVCQEVKRNTQPFGGMQVIFVGDFFQLPPIEREGEVPAQFAWLSPAWAAAKPMVCYLTEQHRQEDAVFLNLLKAVRRSAVTAGHRDTLDGRQADSENMAAGLTKLFSHNADVDRINQGELDQISADQKTFVMSTKGRAHLVETLQRGCLSPQRLLLKVGAVVMFTKNSPTGQFVNGTLGEVVGFDRETRCPVVKKRTGQKLVVLPMQWVIEDNGRVLASIAQIPLRLAWAMTVHKSQGMSLDAAFMDLRGAFVPGQGYVALSRVRTLAGLFLAGYNEQALEVHSEVLAADELFRQQSDALAAEFSKLPASELKKMHVNFVKAASPSPHPSPHTGRGRRRKKLVKKRHLGV